MADLNKQKSAASEKKEVSKKNKKSKRSLGERLKKFWRDYKSELLKIVWCPWKQVRKNSTLVIVAVIIISAVIGLLDFGFSNAIVYLGKLI
ncbi:MAG: preprotein translocase subunit SecE [Clostridiales bacterium]|nr:preprotein translocase subunit SecE [Clostridiales bacterium]